MQRDIRLVGITVVRKASMMANVQIPGVRVFVMALGLLIWNNSAVSAQTAYTVLPDKQEGQARKSTQRIRLVMKSSTIGSILLALGKEVNQPVMFNDKDPRFAQRMSVQITEVNVMNAFATVLKGTGLVAVLGPDGRTIVVSAVKEKTKPIESKGVGRVIGRVVDSVSKKGVAGATITLVGTSLRTVTNELGRFVLADVPVGEQSVSIRLFGYKAVERAVTVPDSGQVTVNVMLLPVAATLSEVVTTITGEQRKIEVGNDITTIKVDSVIQKYPVATMSELLATRVPGLYAARTSGQPGAPTRIRIRGVSSLNTSNEPVIVIDGVQVRSEDSQVENRGAGFAFSPLDQIDLNSVETVEVLKGPSAVALYGSDAANGVIVITTKRGQAGQARWTFAGSWGAQTMPGSWPVNYFGWGTARTGAPNQCTHDSFADYGCSVDSVSVYQILNNSATTVFGQGAEQRYSAGVSGGSRTLTYAFTLSSNQILGLVKLPDEDIRVLKDDGQRIPNWQRRPQAADNQSGTATIGMELGRSTTMTFTSALARTAARSTPLSGAIATAATFAPGKIEYDVNGVPLPAGSGLLQSIRNFRERQYQSQLSSRYAVDIRSNTYRRITVTGTAGVDIASGSDTRTFAHGDCYMQGTGFCSDSGFFNVGHMSQLRSNLKLNLSAPLIQSYLMTIQSSIGGEYTLGSNRRFDSEASNIMVGATSGTDATRKNFTDTRGETKAAGMYLEFRIGIADRFWLPLAIRSDAGSTFGGNVRPTFPKLGFSYLISDQPLFQSIPLVGRLSNLRLRAAYGVAGKQPGIADKVRTYRESDVLTDGRQVTIARLNSIGNPDLRPERSKEFEWGIDTDILEGSRGSISLIATWARKYTSDLVVDDKLPPSVNGGGRQVKNLGDVINTGAEFSVTGLLNTKLVTWSPRLGLTRSSNKIVRINSESENFTNIFINDDVFERNKIGYPLFARWAVPLVGYWDRNDDGFITEREVSYADSAVYIGAPYPKFTMDIGNEITLLSRIAVAGILRYENGLNQVREKETYGRVENDPTASLREQAYGLYTVLTRTQTVSTLRFESFQVSFFLPQSFTRSVIGRRTATLALGGKNLGLWTDYRGKDPNVGAVGERIIDNGVLPTPRVWSLSMRIN